MIVFREEYVVYTTHIIYEYGIFQGIKCCNIIYPKNVRRTGHKWIGRKISHSLPWYLSNRSQLYKCFKTNISQQQTFLISGTHYICRYQSVSLFRETVCMKFCIKVLLLSWKCDIHVWNFRTSDIHVWIELNGQKLIK